MVLSDFFSEASGIFPLHSKALALNLLWGPPLSSLYFSLSLSCLAALFPWPLLSLQALSGAVMLPGVLGCGQCPAPPCPGQEQCPGCQPGPVKGLGRKSICALTEGGRRRFLWKQLCTADFGCISVVFRKMKLPAPEQNCQQMTLVPGVWCHFS